MVGVEIRRFRLQENIYVGLKWILHLSFRYFIGHSVGGGGAGGRRGEEDMTVRDWLQF